MAFSRKFYADGLRLSLTTELDLAAVRLALEWIASGGIVRRGQPLWRIYFGVTLPNSVTTSSFGKKRVGHTSLVRGF